MLAQWLAQSTEPSSAAAGAVRFALDLDELRALLQSYFASDLWPFPDPAAPWSADPPSHWRALDLPPRRSAAGAGASATSWQVTVDRLPTDHWVHAEDPEGLLRVLAARLPS